MRTHSVTQKYYSIIDILVKTYKHISELMIYICNIKIIFLVHYCVYVHYITYKIEL